MNVYVALKGCDYEGFLSPLGVFANLGSAKACFEGSTEWTWISDKSEWGLDDTGRPFWEWIFSGGVNAIIEYEVKP